MLKVPQSTLPCSISTGTSTQAAIQSTESTNTPAYLISFRLSQPFSTSPLHTGYLHM